MKSNYGKSNRIGRPRGLKASRGFSLMELMLVLAIMVFFASMLVPSVFQMIRSQNLGKGAELVRASMGSARVKAMKTGKIHAFYMVPNESWFDIDLFSNVSSLPARARKAIDFSRNTSREDFEENLLPKGIIFSEEKSELDPQAAEVLSVSGGGNSGMVRPILFYPDGTSQNAVVTIQDDRGARVQVSLRGLTGSSTITRLRD